MRPASAARDKGKRTCVDCRARDVSNPAVQASEVLRTSVVVTNESSSAVAQARFRDRLCKTCNKTASHAFRARSCVQCAAASAGATQSSARDNQPESLSQLHSTSTQVEFSPEQGSLVAVCEVDEQTSSSRRPQRTRVMTASAASAVLDELNVQ